MKFSRAKWKNEIVWETEVFIQKNVSRFLLSGNKGWETVFFLLLYFLLKTTSILFFKLRTIYLIWKLAPVAGQAKRSLFKYVFLFYRFTVNYSYKVIHDWISGVQCSNTIPLPVYFSLLMSYFFSASQPASWQALFSFFLFSPPKGTMAYPVTDRA